MVDTKENSFTTILTWNIQVGTDRLLNNNGWKKRKLALISALKAIQPDVFCTQEARLEQLKFIDNQFPKWNRIGVGRDDGKNRGEFCAIYFNAELIEVSSSGTFWLSTTPDKPQNTWDGPYKRICTHALFRDKRTETKFAVLSTHFPLNRLASTKAADIVLRKISTLYKDMPTLVCGDFNCEPGSEAWSLFSKASLEAVNDKNQKTWHISGTPIACLDSIFKSSAIQIMDQKLIDDSYNNTYPSDHFGLLLKAFIGTVD